MFKEAIRDVVEGTDGGLAGILMDFEGIAVDSYVKGDLFDINAVGAEYSVILKSIQRATESLEAGGPRRVADQSAKGTTLLRNTNAQDLLPLTLSPHRHLGHGRQL